MLDLVGQRFGWPDWIARATIVAAAIGFVITLVLAWYHGERGQQRVTGIELFIVAVLLAIGGGLLWRVAHPSLDAAPVAAATPAPAVGAPAGLKAIALPPLAHTSGDPSKAYFSDGLSQQLVSVLPALPALT